MGDIADAMVRRFMVALGLAALVGVLVGALARAAVWWLVHR